MTLGELTKDASPYLVSWINLTTAPKVPTTLYDLKKIKRLEEKNFPGPCGGYGARALAPVCKRGLSRSGKRSWALLGELSGLQTLAFPRGTPPGIIGDFSFLPRLKNLQRLGLV